MRSIAILTLVLLAGCEGQRWREIPCPQIEVPAANLPLALREKNWPDATGSGSCVIASSIYVLQWHNQQKLAEYFRKSYAGGQTATSIKAKWAASQVPFQGTDTGDPAFLEWVTHRRGAAIIWYYPNHCVAFCGFSNWQGQEVAWVCDNNRIQRFIPIPKQQFIREWRGYGGFALAPVLTPAPPIPFEGYEKS